MAESNANCTFIAHKPVQIDVRHNISLTNLGNDVFNYYLSHPEYKFTNADQNYVNQDWSVAGFFQPNCNQIIQDFVSSALGSNDDEGDVSENGVIYTNWERF